jgi:hypothetical protein
VISVLIFCVLVAVVAVLVLYSLFQLDNPLVIPQVVAAMLAALLALTLAAMISNGQVADIVPLVNQTATKTTAVWETAQQLPTEYTTYTYADHRTVWTDPSIGLILTLVGVCASILAIVVTVLASLRIFLFEKEES